MIAPVDLDDFFIAFFSAAMVILAGALYALFFTLAKHMGKVSWHVAAYGSYGVLALNVLLLADALHLKGFWEILVWLMLGGYLLAPHGIWHLCVATHDDATPAGGNVVAEEQQTT